jgi:phosphoribosylanthranilate isomerase
VRVLVKICGVTSADNAAMVAAAGVDFLGLNFWPRSRRYLAIGSGAEVAAAARAEGARVVGLFVDATLAEIEAVHRQVSLDVVQLHGEEPPERVAEVAVHLGLPVWKALPLGDAAAVERLAAYPAATAVLLDAPSAGRGGSGQTIALELLALARRRHPARDLILAGGLTPDNVAAAIAAARPWAVDAASGVELAAGQKDPRKVRSFIDAVRSVDPGDVLRD